MKLHEDKYSFLNIIGLIHESSGIREDIIEKDYYVTLLLNELAEKQAQLPAYFKGGTALYKAQKRNWRMTGKAALQRSMTISPSRGRFS